MEKSCQEIILVNWYFLFVGTWSRAEICLTDWKGKFEEIEIRELSLPIWSLQRRCKVLYTWLELLQDSLEDTVYHMVLHDHVYFTQSPSRWATSTDDLEEKEYNDVHESGKKP